MPATPELLAKVEESFDHLKWALMELKTSDQDRDEAALAVELTAKNLELDKAALASAEADYKADAETAELALQQLGEDLKAVTAE